MAGNVEKLKVSDDHMKENYDSLVELRNKLATDMDSVMDVVDLLNADYQGYGYNEFRNAVIKGIESVKELSTYMDTFLNAYANSIDTYRATEREVYNMIHDEGFFD